MFFSKTSSVTSRAAASLEASRARTKKNQEKWTH